MAIGQLGEMSYLCNVPPLFTYKATERIRRRYYPSVVCALCGVLSKNWWYSFYKRPRVLITLSA